MEIVRYNAEEWSALYIDGKLDRVSDAYLVDERVGEILGVKVISGDEGEDFLRGGNTREDVAQTLTDISDWKSAQEAESGKAELLAQADALQAEVDRLRAAASN
jgi:hypothetical protein